MTVEKWVSRPVTVHAMCWDGTNHAQIAKWLTHQTRMMHPDWTGEARCIRAARRDSILVNTGLGSMILWPGDYVVLNQNKQYQRFTEEELVANFTPETLL